MKKQGRVVQGKILVKQDEAETVTGGGILIMNQEKPKQGIVVVVGESTERVDTLCEVGDRVYFVSHAGTPIVMDDDELDLHGEYLLMEWTNVLLFNK